MLENSPREEWVTLKEAALMLNCSVKTIRRRVEAGKLKSMVEYRGNRAIRLVSRSEVLVDAPPLEALLPAGSRPEGLSSIRDEVPLRLELALRQSFQEFSKQASRGEHRTRLYVIISVGIGLICLAVFFFFIQGLQSGIIQKHIETFRGDVNSTLQAGTLSSQAESKRASQSARVARVLGEASLLELETTRKEVTVLRSELAGLQEELGRLQTALKGLEVEQGEGLGRLETLIKEQQAPTPTPAPTPEEQELLPPETIPGEGD